jgi:nicotinamide mononucleotide adenylyltransferase
MSHEQRERYADAIVTVARSERVRAVTIPVLFAAADLAVAESCSDARASAGLQPGTFDPVHYGHITAALAALLGTELDGVVLAVGGEVPDKSACPFDHRFAMAGAALRELGVDVVGASDVRQQAFEMFESRPDALPLAGDTPMTRRRNTDLAAFIWLFRANPLVRWTYIVGADKVRDITAGETARQQAALRQRSRLTIKGTLEYQACDATVC